MDSLSRATLEERRTSEMHGGAGHTRRGAVSHSQQSRVRL